MKTDTILFGASVGDWLLKLRTMAVFLTTAVIGFAADVPIFDGNALNNPLFPINYQRGVNLRSGRGIPMSAVVGNPAGSDGRGVQGQTLGQFQSVFSAGGVVRPEVGKRVKVDKYQDLNGAKLLGLPISSSGSAELVLARATLGAPYYSRASSVKFGEVISPPAFGIDGGALTNGVTPDIYWRAEPHTDNAHATDRFYWSPHARAVFATQPGPVSITWRRSDPLLPPPVDGAAGVAAIPPKYVLEAGLYFQLTNISYVVSGFPGKTPVKTIYWTENSFRILGKPVELPSSKVGLVVVVTNTAFPARTPTQYYAPGEPPGPQRTEGTNSTVVARTLWAENGYLHADNAEGRVFVELLGQPVEGDRRRWLGCEVVDVKKYPTPVQITSDLGDLIAPNGDGTNPYHLRPELVVQSADSRNILYQHVVAGAEESEYFAARETSAPNEALVHWMLQGDAGLLWPQTLASYQIGWPTAPDRYEHYLRPVVTSPADASRTPVQLPTGGTPAIQYQDPVTGALGAHLDGQGKFYTYLNAELPAHRTLLRVQRDSAVAFVRVLSWLDRNLKSSDLAMADYKDTFAGQIDGIREYYEYPFKVLPGLQAKYLSDLTRGVNGTWSLIANDHRADDFTSIASSADGLRWVAVTSVRDLPNGLGTSKGFVYTSVDSGANWALVKGSDRNPLQGVNFTKVALSTNGSVVAAIESTTGFVLISSNYLTSSAPSWLKFTPGGGGCTGVDISADGTKVIVSSTNGLYRSVNAGVSWTNIQSGSFVGVVTSADFTKVVAVTGSGRLYQSTNSGASFTTNAFQPSVSGMVGDVEISDNGLTLCASITNRLFYSTNGGISFSFIDHKLPITDIDLSTNGTVALVAYGSDQIGQYDPSQNSLVYRDVSPATGVQSVPLSIRAICSSKNPLGAKYVAASSDSKLFTSPDSFQTSTERRLNAIQGFTLAVIQTNAISHLLQTNSFPFPSNANLNFGKQDYLSNSVSVGGITNRVLGITVRVAGISGTSAEDLDLYLASPGAKFCPLLSEVGGSNSIATITLDFNDAAALPAPISGPLVNNATYRPTNRNGADQLANRLLLSLGETLGSLLLPAPPVDIAAPPLLPDPTPFAGVPDANRPVVVNVAVNVGDRIAPPTGEADLAGYIPYPEGQSFDPDAYQNPLIAGFGAAKLGAILAVNAIPGKAPMEVWWFREGKTNAVLHPVNGIGPVYWPAVVGRYTPSYPAAGTTDEIVLASNAGSGGLDSLQAKGSIYYRNTPGDTGYNPNEEHALMLGGQAFALRDDLNVTAAGPNYSSEPMVLLKYVANDGRPAMRPFRVLREKPEAGIVFDYVVQAGGNADRGGAGKPLQAPMPLPLLPPPVDDGGINRNTENSATSGDTPPGWDPSAIAQYDPFWATYPRFTFRDRKENFWVKRGVHGGQPVLASGTYDPATKSYASTLPTATAIKGRPFTNCFHVSRMSDALTLSTKDALPDGLKIEGMSLVGIPNVQRPATNTYRFVLTDAGDPTVAVTNTLTVRLLTNGTPVAQGPLVMTYRSTTLVGRPPYVAEAPVPTNSFSMRFYYRTQEGFAWPGRKVPTVGSIVPYLTESADADPTSSATAALPIVYRPVWPGNPPSIRFGDTLTSPKENLPAIRGQTSVELLYQQSQALAFEAGGAKPTQPSVILHDPTRRKTFDLRKGGLEKLPGSVKVQNYLGKVYFPDLPPHLAKRVFFDASLSKLGTLVLKGEYQEPGLGRPFLQLNVLRGNDLLAVQNLCTETGQVKADWDNAIAGFAAPVPYYVRDIKAPGGYRLEEVGVRSVGVGDLVEVGSALEPVDSYALSVTGPGSGYVTLVVGNGSSAQTPSGEPVTVYVIKTANELYPGEVKVIASDNPLSELSTFEHSPDLAGKFDEYDYQWQIAPPLDGLKPEEGSAAWTDMGGPVAADRALYVLGGAGVQALSDNYIRVRYRPNRPTHPLYVAKVNGQWPETGWSLWTSELAEGWIKRVLAGINPFNQRVTDLFNNQVNTDANILTSAGKRWEGDIALNLAKINDYGLIEIYETVLNRGRGLSIDAGINYGPANDALLLAAGYLNDLYMLVGNEAYADAANPTIGIGTKDQTYGDIATSLFSFKGQLPSLLEEELALLRGRDDTLAPGVETPPVYNRLVWNYTRGIDSGEVIYSLNYNILDQNTDGKVDASDAAKLFPQGHGDAYGHYLTAVKGYYSLLLNNSFAWVPRIESVTVLGKAVSVDYMDERKFAGAAAALARTGRQIFDLTWRRDYQAGNRFHWDQFSPTRTSKRKVLDGVVTNSVVREWGSDQWASRVQQGTFLNWVVGNALLPYEDPDPSHEGIQKIDRTTVPELQELAVQIAGLQTALDSAEGALTPLGLSEGSLSFDMDPNLVVGANAKGHFEQVYDRAKVALNNAVASFDDAKGVTQLMRSEQDSLESFQTEVERQELAFNGALIEIYGTPYPDDMGPGKAYPNADYDGPDLLNYRYVDNPEFINGPAVSTNQVNVNGRTVTVDTLGHAANAIWDANGAVGDAAFKIDIQTTDKWPAALATTNWVVPALGPDGRQNPNYIEGVHYISVNWGPHGFLDKPARFKGKRKSPGRLQADISEVIAAYNHLYNSYAAAMSDKEDLDKKIQLFNAEVAKQATLRENFVSIQDKTAGINRLNRFLEMANQMRDGLKEMINASADAIADAIPDVFVAGLASGGSIGAIAKGIGKTAAAGSLGIVYGGNYAVMAGTFGGVDAYETEIQKLELQNYDLENTSQLQEMVYGIGLGVKQVQAAFITINEDTRRLQNAYERVRADVAAGERIEAERLVARRRAAAVVQGYRARDAAFRIFRNEKLERYKSLFDLASRYAYMAANAYDYETGLLGSAEGKTFVNRIISSRALGVVKNGEPQYAGSNTGDPGLSSAMAEMKADWDVLRGRLGFNNPDAYGTTVSLRTEQLRILPGTDGDTRWQDVLQRARRANLLDDGDVKRYCQQIDPGGGMPVPGLVLTFSTTIEPGRNLFGLPTAAGDHGYSLSSFATKLFAAGVALENYQGMDDPVANTGAVGAAGGVSATPPSVTFLSADGLSATPYIYLIPVGVDSMRSPPLGDVSTIRSWNVNDAAVPLPFNLGASDFSSAKLYQSADALSEPLFTLRKHQAFRPVSKPAAFATDIYGSGGSLRPSQFTNRRLIGRSVWNTQWKLVIPGYTLLNDPNEGLDRFVRTVKDVKLHFVTYSFSGN